MKTREDVDQEQTSGCPRCWSLEVGRMVAPISFQLAGPYNENPLLLFQLT